jgi:hypothetical protein
MSSTVTRIGKYELRAVLARTQMSSVYDGWDSDIARRVAIKVTPLSNIGDDDGGIDALTRFKRGAQAAGKLSHPNIVSIYDYGESGDQAYLVMEFVDGPTLRELFDQRHGFNLQEIGTIIGGMLDALQYSHDHGVVHRDIKPDNIMFANDMRLKLTDFGIARLEDSDMTRTGMVIGTPAYMSPEQFLGEPIDRRTDVYSTGVVLYNMLTGERPYEGSLATIMHKVLYTSPPAPSRLSSLATSALDEVVLRAMAKKREERFGSAAEFKAALQAALAPREVRHRMAPLKPARPAAVPADTNRSSHRYREIGLLASVVVAIAATGIGAAWYMREGPTAPRVATAVPTVPRTELKPAEPPRGAGDIATPVAPAPAPMIQPPAETPGSSTADIAPSPAYPNLPTPVEPPASSDGDLRPGLGDGSSTAPAFSSQASNMPGRSEAPPLPVPPVPRAAPERPKPELHRPPVAAVPDKRPIETPGKPRIALNEGKNGAPAPGRFLDDPARPFPAPASPAGSNASSQRLAGPEGTGSSATEPGGRAAPPAGQTASAEPPGQIERPISTSKIGLLCQAVTPEAAPDLGLDTPRGLLVTGVVVGSGAYNAGIRQHDVILTVKGSSIRDLYGLAAIAAGTPPGQSVPVEIMRDKKTQVVQLKVDQIRR